MAKRTYGQYCAVAKTLDLVGERWTLLVVRDLLDGPKRYTDLLEALPGCGTSLLSDRLRTLQHDGIIIRRRLPPPAASDVYELTDAGQDLGIALVPLARWGARHALGARQPDETFRTVWPLFVLQASIDPRELGRTSAVIEFDVDGSVAHLRIGDGRVSAHDGAADRPDVRLTMDVDTFVAVGTGRVAPQDAVASGRVDVDGDAGAVTALVALLEAWKAPQTPGSSATATGPSGASV